MKRIREFFSIHYSPSTAVKIVLALLPFLISAGVYYKFASERHAINPDDKLLPLPGQMLDEIKRYAFQRENEELFKGSEEPVSKEDLGDILFLKDTLASLKRLVIGTSISAISALLVGLLMGMFPWFRSFGRPFVTFLSIVPPLSILPIIFIVFGVEEMAKIMLIIIGTSFLMSRDINLVIEAIPREQIVKALTLGANSFQIIWKIIIPQIMPRFLEMTRIYLSPAWLFLIAAEAIASQDGLAYRIFLARRYMNMAQIIPIVLWITFIGFIMNYLLKVFIRWRYPWYMAEGK
ncbi:ABC transporter permease subunit [Candidatus Falkowbacteria bacterium]|nr:ABC transporter permease subunit [Candidatus Falkowbacteria bacterium]